MQKKLTALVLPKHVSHIVILCAFVIIAYYPSLGVPFLFDDLPNIVLNPAVHPQNISELPKTFSSQFSASRPLSMLSFSLNYLFGGLDVFGYHLFNIFIHLLNTILLYQLLRVFPGQGKASSVAAEIMGRKDLAFWSAALWALNPVQTQAVTYIVQRMTSMATFFYLAGIYLFISWRTDRISKKTAIPLLVLSFILGMACKEIVVTLPLALILLEYLCISKKMHRWLAGSLLIVVFAALFVGYRYIPHDLATWLAKYPGRNFSPWERLMTQARIIWHYLALFLVPLPTRLHLTYDPVVSAGLFSPWTTVAGVLGIIGTLVATWRIRLQFSAAAFAIVFFFLAISLESSFINLELAFIHRLYLPSTFLAFAFLSLVPLARIKKSTLLLLLVLAIFAFWTIKRNVDWQQPYTFWQQEQQRGSAPARSINNQAAALIDSGKYEQAITLLKNGLQNYETSKEQLALLYNLGSVYYYRNNLVESFGTFDALIDKFGGYRNTHLFIGKIFIRQNKLGEARKVAEALGRVEGFAYQGAILEALLAEKEQNIVAAGEIIEREILLVSPARSEPYLQLQFALAGIYLQQGRSEDSYAIFLDIIDRFPDYYAAWKKIYFMLEAGGDEEAAQTVKKFLIANDVAIKKPADSE